ncbi:MULTISPECIES: SigB/SigF/SigG family RNA polymerase sigma factor [unclassified Solwaraspora]|uniref:SigB/SigF/SigG family RNA polymerase sigma factor n=1 Tax=unclassified Solwaraspora TaxID=2627926 RepID=UPI00259BE00D|nr:SigB/SigF/SigG family RNA polymerase sigma factor [Solwaraspora sp. WMMA2056]WJK39051.1 SigB/SigF/SigG family RNA polymerase sigma factor [Solwaraspora sp. WMMA2056]
MSGQRRTATRSEHALEDLDGAALSYAARFAEQSEGRRRDHLREELVQLALPFAGRLARRYRGRGEPLEDLEQVARLGLVKAVDRYDPERGSFTAYAAVTITGEIKRHFRDRTWGVHVPRRLQDLTIEVSQATAVLTSELSRSPTVAELAARLETSEEDILAALESAAGYTPASLNGPVGDDGPAELGDMFGALDADLESVDDRLTVSGLLYRLPARERRILAMRFYGNYTQSDIAAEFGISQMHVSRLLSRTLTWLRQAMLTDTPPRWESTGAPPEPPDAVTVSVDRADGRVQVGIRGELDRSAAERIRCALVDVVCAAGTDEVLVDLDGVGFIDAAGIAALLASHEAARRAAVRLRITDPQPYVRRSLVVAGLAPLFT